MKNYIRTCLSLDKETRNRIADISKILKTNKSETVKRAISTFYLEIVKMIKEEW